MTKLVVSVFTLALATGGLGCTEAEEPQPEALRGTIGPQGGELVGAKGTSFDGVRLQIPAGALATATEIAVVRAESGTALPVTAVRCGPMFALQPAGLALHVPASVTLPFDGAVVDEQYRFEDQVKVWVAEGQGWGQRLQTDNASGTVTVEVDKFSVVAAGVNPPQANERVRFALHPNPAVAKCLARFPDDKNADRQPAVEVTVVKGDQNDGLFLRGRNIRAGLAFDMFLVETSQLDAQGAVDPAFKNFGQAMYVSDLGASDRGRLNASIRGVFLNENFSFNPNSNQPPLSMFEVGFWFDDPKGVEACNFDVNKATPFNPKHQAGPMAMISVPDAKTGLGPLCTQPDTSVVPAVCLVGAD